MGLNRSDKEYIALGKAFELFLSNERFRILGTAELGKSGYQHIGMEIWTKYNSSLLTPEVTEDNKKILYKYILGMKGLGELKKEFEIEDLIYYFEEPS